MKYTIHEAGSAPALVWQILNEGDIAIAHFRQLNGETREHAEAYVTGCEVSYRYNHHCQNCDHRYCSECLEIAANGSAYCCLCRKPVSRVDVILAVKESQ